MPSTDSRVDAYLATAPEFARPILAHLRAAVHDAVPEVEEGIKWSRPHFLLDGRILCGMSAFKAHCAFGFWANREAAGAASGAADGEAMGQFGRLTSVKDLPPKATLKRLIKEAAVLTRAGPAPRPAAASASRGPRPEAEVPNDLRAALAACPPAQAAFTAFAPSHRRDYVEWIVEAKKDDTRARRLAQAIDWMAQGRHRNWKYEGGC
jgi:uncharacterized protein YdeI (YjbR/CyaY-like superfamily)